MSEVRVVAHDVVPDLAVDGVVLRPEDNPSVTFKERSSEDAVDVVQVGPVDPRRVAVEETLSIAELIVVSRSGCLRRTADMHIVRQTKCKLKVKSRKTSVLGLVIYIDGLKKLQGFFKTRMYRCYHLYRMVLRSAHMQTHRTSFKYV